MDTMTYASVAVLPWSIAQDRTRPVRAEVEYIRLDLSMIKRWRPSAGRFLEKPSLRRVWRKGSANRRLVKREGVFVLDDLNVGNMTKVPKALWRNPARAWHRRRV